jgi:hypothetical protein
VVSWLIVPPLLDKNRGLPDATMISAIYTGLFLNENETIPHLTPTCLTGNCTWPIFYTLGVCANVADLTDQLSLTCPHSSEKDETCNYTLPNGVTLMTGYNNMVISPPPTDTKSLKFPGPNKPILDFFIINTDLNATYGAGGKDSGYDWDYYTGANALECVVRFCVLSTNTTVTHGQPYTEQTEVWANASLRNPIIVSQLWFELWLEPKDQGTAYVIPQGSRDAITYWADGIFTGYSQGGPAQNLYSSDTVQLFGMAMQRRPRSEHKTAVSNMMRNVALSMTNK